MLLDTLPSAIGVERLLIDAIAATILSIGPPGDDPASIAERRDLRQGLIADSKGVDMNLPSPGVLSAL
jgi:hypothetical protein